jgi:tRNA pseudouridine55 synthase
MGRRGRKRNHRLPELNIDGILLVDKPTDWTSHDVVGFVRSRYNIGKVGHCGTLDPAATGLLVLVLGRFTKLSQKFSGDDKVYDATLLLGTETDSQDMEGEVIAQEAWEHITEDMVKEAFTTYIGEQQQIPPMVSAIKKGGKKLYELAREGKTIERDPRDIVINSIDIERIDLPEVDYIVSCSKGTYIRTLCSDMGKSLKSVGVLKQLRRTKSGVFDIADAITIDKIKELEQEEFAAHVSDFLGRFILENKELMG